MREIKLANNEYYHIFNRGVDKRKIFSDYEDVCRFFQSMEEFNTLEPIGSIFENSLRKKKYGHSVSKQINLVDFVCYCLNPNHYHFVLKQLVDNGIEKFMHRLGNGYTKYFNHRYERIGSLFQGRYKAVHINSNEYLLHVSAYVNLNDRVHRFGHSVSKSSWDEYVKNDNNSFCEKGIILRQFRNSSEYREFAESSLIDIQERKDMEKFLLE